MIHVYRKSRNWPTRRKLAKEKVAMFQGGMKRRQAGFTLVEIAIVMVIIGLLIGGILKGQAMVQNAKVKRVVKQADEIRAAVMAFYDKYGVYPGDENLAAIPPGTDAEGDGDGMIEQAGNEIYEVYRDLQLAELISGNYNGTSDLPKHAFGSNMDLIWVDPGPGEAKHYFRFYNLPAEVCLEIDMKYDDGDRNTGSIQASEDYTPGNTVGTFYMLF
jgi:prepilin-type N-terminal cleavage/methylation domain-containing protein